MTLYNCSKMNNVLIMVKAKDVLDTLSVIIVLLLLLLLLLLLVVVVVVVVGGRW